MKRRSGWRRRARSSIAGEKSTPTPTAGCERGQQIAVAAAELEDPQARRHEEPVDVLEPR